MTTTKKQNIIEILNQSTSPREIAKRTGSTEKNVRNVIRKYIRSANTKEDKIFRALYAGWEIARIVKLTKVNKKYVNDCKYAYIKEENHDCEYLYTRINKKDDYSIQHFHLFKK
jgi:predicted transcriptional regulator